MADIMQELEKRFDELWKGMESSSASDIDLRGICRQFFRQGALSAIEESKKARDVT